MEDAGSPVMNGLDVDIGYEGLRFLFTVLRCQCRPEGALVCRRCCCVTSSLAKEHGNPSAATEREMQEGALYLFTQITGPCDLCSDDVEVGYDAPGYSINFSIVLLIFAMHIFWFVQVRRRARAELYHVGCVQQEGLMQKGYRNDRVGTCIKTLSILYAVWMQVSLVITIMSNYSGHWYVVFGHMYIYTYRWNNRRLLEVCILTHTSTYTYRPYSPGTSSDINSRVTWDSFTRAFLLPWIGTFCVLSCVRAYRDELTTFYMSPCSLIMATRVRIVCVVPDESGNPITSQGVLPVLNNEDCLAYLEWQLLRLVYCATTEAFTASPAAQDGDKPQTLATGQWAGGLVAGGGLTAEAASKLMRGVQGKNEISIEVPGVLQACVAEFYNMFYIYQLFAITISFYWDYVLVGFMFAVKKKKSQESVLQSFYKCKNDYSKNKDYSTGSSKNLENE
jgi:hypothetical protein